MMIYNAISVEKQAEMAKSRFILILGKTKFKGAKRFE